MPLAQQVWNTYRNRAFAFWLQKNGVDVIPNVQWGDERSYEFCFDGLPQNSTIAVSTNGCIQGKAERYYFKKGLRNGQRKGDCIMGKGFGGYWSDTRGSRVGNRGNTAAADWTGKTSELAKTFPVKIPENATIKSGTKVAGYDQISYKWSENGYIYEARWHTKTPGAPAGQGNTWVVERVTHGTPTGQQKVTHIKVGETWVTRRDWQRAIEAYQNGTMTAAQETMLKAGHWLAP